MYLFVLYPFPVTTFVTFCVLWQKDMFDDINSSTALACKAVWKLVFKPILLKDSFLHLCYRTSLISLHISFKIAEHYYALSLYTCTHSAAKVWRRPCGRCPFPTHPSFPCPSLPPLIPPFPLPSLSFPTPPLPLEVGPI